MQAYFRRWDFRLMLIGSFVAICCFATGVWSYGIVSALIAVVAFGFWRRAKTREWSGES